VLLDNMTTAAIRKAVEDVHLFNEATGHDVTTEASGRMTPETARTAAEAGVDFVSAGALTHSARAIDIALDVDKSGQRTRRRASGVPTVLTRRLQKPRRPSGKTGRRPKKT
jgi:hypothetical protein